MDSGGGGRAGGGTDSVTHDASRYIERDLTPSSQHWLD